VRIEANTSANPKRRNSSSLRVFENGYAGNGQQRGKLIRSQSVAQIFNFGGK
jgi:hypothetical protein